MYGRTTFFSNFLAAALLAGCAPVTERSVDRIEPFGTVAMEAAATIDVSGLRRTIATLASDKFEGRGPASLGDVMTQTYLSERLDRLGYVPAGDAGGWLQPFNIVSITTTPPNTWTFSTSGKSVILNQWDDFIAGSGIQERLAEINDAELVFVGYGITAPEFGWNDFKDLDVRGKVLLIMNNDPDWDPDLFQGNRRLYYGRWSYKYEMAAELGAAGVIVIHTTPSAGYPYQVVQTSWTGAQYQLPSADEPRTPIQAWVTEAAAAQLASLAGYDLKELVESARSANFVPVSLGLTTSLSLKNELSHVQTANVAGLLKGRDPILRNEVLILTAHHDHLGVGEPDETGDTIYNGALDNAAGVSQVMAIAEALQSLPEAPRRSVLILLVAAEEQGLLGSEYYARNPSFAPGRIVANLNLDGANIWGRTRDVTFIGYNKSTLDTVVERAVAYQGRSVQGDQFPDRGYFYRSDQFNFAKIGVPAVYLDGGTDFIGRPEGWGVEQINEWTEVYYHQPSDELKDSWDFDGIVEDARLAFHIALTIAEQDEVPSWYSGDEFEAVRQAALAEL